MGAVPSDAKLAIYIRPAELAKAKMAAPVVAAFDELLQEAKLGFSVADVEEFLFYVLGPAGGPNEPVIIVRQAAAYDWKKFYEAHGQVTEEEIDGHPVLHVYNGRELVALPDDRTSIYGEPPTVMRILEKSEPNNRAEWHDRWDEAVKHPLAGMMWMDLVGKGPKGAGGHWAVLAKDGKYAVMHGEVTAAGLKLTGVIETSSADAAARVAPAAADVLVDFANMIVEELALPAEDSKDLTGELSKLLGSGELSTRRSSVDIKGLVTPAMLEVFSNSARLAAQKNR